MIGAQASPPSSSTYVPSVTCVYRSHTEKEKEDGVPPPIQRDSLSATRETPVCRNSTSFLAMAPTTAEPHEPWQEYRIIRELGAGTQGSVREAVHIPTGRRVAIKSLRKDAAGARESLEAEVNALRGVRHPHIIALLDVFETARSFCLVFELAEGGTLFDSILEMRTFTEEDACICVSTVVNALDFLHNARGICHRDIKTPNLQFKSKEPDAPLVILDFGIAKSFDPNAVAMKTQIGSPLFMAPEILQGKPYGPEVDMFAVGVITYQCLTGLHPTFGYVDQADLFRRIIEGRFDFSDETFDGISSLAKDFCRRLLETNPAKRMTAQDAMRHPWIHRYCPRGYLEILRRINVEAEEESEPLYCERNLARAKTLANQHSRSDSMLHRKLKRARTADSIPGVFSVSSKYEVAIPEALPNLLDGELARSRFRNALGSLSLSDYLARGGANRRKSRSHDESPLSLLAAELDSMGPTTPSSGKRALFGIGRSASFFNDGEESADELSPTSPKLLNTVNWDTDETTEKPIAAPAKKVLPKKGFLIDVEYKRTLEEQIEDAFGY